MKNQKIRISQNLAMLRQQCRYSQEEVAEKIGVSRQAVAKWESGETVPDIGNCDALARLFDVSVDDLLHFDPGGGQLTAPPRGKHIFGTVRMGERGQIVLPKKAREIFGLKPGDLLVVLGDEDPERGGIALVLGEQLLQTAEFFRQALRPAEETPEKEEA